MSAKIIQFPNAQRVLGCSDAPRAVVPAGRPGREASANPFDADYRSAIICEALFGERK